MTLKNIILLGATGSIGKSTLKLIRKKREKFNLIGISAYEKTEHLKLISEEFDVKNVVITDFKSFIKLKNFYL